MREHGIDSATLEPINSQLGWKMYLASTTKKASVRSLSGQRRTGIFQVSVNKELLESL